MAGPCYYVNINFIGNSALYCTEKSEGDLQLFCKRKRKDGLSGKYPLAVNFNIGSHVEML